MKSLCLISIIFHIFQINNFFCSPPYSFGGNFCFCRARQKSWPTSIKTHAPPIITTIPSHSGCCKTRKRTSNTIKTTISKIFFIIILPTSWPGSLSIKMACYLLDFGDPVDQDGFHILLLYNKFCMFFSLFVHFFTDTVTFFMMIPETTPFFAPRSSWTHRLFREYASYPKKGYDCTQQKEASPIHPYLTKPPCILQNQKIRPYIKEKSLPKQNRQIFIHIPQPQDERETFSSTRIRRGKRALFSAFSLHTRRKNTICLAFLLFFSSWFCPFIPVSMRIDAAFDRLKFDWQVYPGAMWSPM